MAAVGQLLTQATHPAHVSGMSRHSEQSCFALMPKQASGFATFTFPLRSSNTNAGQNATHAPQPSHNSKSICILGISSSLTNLWEQPKKHFIARLNYRLNIHRMVKLAMRARHFRQRKSIRILPITFQFLRHKNWCPNDKQSIVERQSLDRRVYIARTSSLFV